MRIRNWWLALGGLIVLALAGWLFHDRSTPSLPDRVAHEPSDPARATDHAAKAIEAPQVQRQAATASPVPTAPPQRGLCSGFVLDSAGQPMIGVHVFAISRDGRKPICETHTATEGAFVVDIPATVREPYLVAEEAGFARAVAEVDAQPGTGIVLVLRRLVTLTGRVLSERSGAVVPGCRIEVANRAAHAGPKAVDSHTTIFRSGAGLSDLNLFITDAAADGTYQLDSLAADTAIDLLLVDAAGTRVIHQLAGLPGGLHRVDLHVDAALLRGQALTLRGEPVAEARVRALSTPRGVSHATATTDAFGRFELPFFRTTQDFYVQVAKHGVVTTTRCFRRYARWGECEPFPMLDGCTIVGRITDADATPIGGLELTLDLTRSAADDALYPDRPADTTFGEARHPTLSSDAAGSFEFAGLLPGEAHIAVRHRGHILRRSVMLTTPGDRRQVDLVLPADDLAGATLTGAVRVDGAPAQATIAWRNGDATGARSTDETGAFALLALPPGQVQLSVITRQPRIRVEQVLLLAAGETRHHDVDVRADRGAICGRVLHRDGSPGPGIAVRAIRAGDSPALHGHTRADGSFRFSIDAADRDVPFAITATGAGWMATRPGLLPGSTDVELQQP